MFWVRSYRTVRHWCRSVLWTVRHQCRTILVPKCLGSEVSVSLQFSHWQMSRMETKWQKLGWGQWRMAAAKAWENNAGKIRFGGALTRSLELLNYEFVNGATVHSAMQPVIKLLWSLVCVCPSVHWNGKHTAKVKVGVAQRWHLVLTKFCGICVHSAESAQLAVEQWYTHGRPCV